MKKVFNLALPSIISNITIPLLGLVDLAIVGHMGNVTYIGAIAVGSMIFNVLYWLCGFLRMGTSGMTSQAFGKRDLTEVMRLLVRSLTIAMYVALLFVFCQIPIRNLALILMHPSEQIATQVSIYFSICIFGAPAMLGLYSMTGWYIGMQNTHIPMMVSIMQNIVNIVLSLVFVYQLDMKIEGVALGTLLAQWTGFIVAVVCWVHYYGRLNNYHWLKNLFNLYDIRSFFSVNRDIFIRTLFFISVNFFFISSGAQQGDIILSVNTLLMTLFTIFSYIMDGFAYAGEALCGKYYGARNRNAFNHTHRCLFAWGIIMTVVFTLVYAVGGNNFLMLLTNEKSIVSAASPYFWWAVMIPIVSVAAFIYDGIFIGITATKYMLTSSFAAALGFFVVYLLTKHMLGNHALWLAFLVFLSLRGGVEWIFYMRKIAVWC